MSSYMNIDGFSQSDSEIELPEQHRIAADIAAAYSCGPVVVVHKGKHFD